ncbi:MAG: hypothetical protein JWO82_3938 [Akkermansiaceae bacterium]|nr:hypothetical protein [Akkermansiaceae bacterium]
MNHPLRRSRLFWSGLLSIIFLIWAWSDSRNNSTTFGGGPVAITSANSLIMVTLNNSVPWPIDGSRLPIPAADRRESFPSAGRREFAVDEVKFEFVWVPYFPVISVLSVLWLGLLLGRTLVRRRRSRQHNPSTP